MDSLKEATTKLIYELCDKQDKKLVAQATATLIINELLPRLKKKQISINESPIEPGELWTLAALKVAGMFSTQEIRVMIDQRFHEQIKV